MTEKWTPEDEDRLRRALEQEAAKVYPSPGGLERILNRARQPRWTMAWRSPAVLGMVAAVVTAVAVLGVGAVTLRDQGSSDEAGQGLAPATSSAPVTSEPVSPSPEATKDDTDEPVTSHPTSKEPSRPPVTQQRESGFTGAVPVYFVNDTRAGFRLAREWIPVESQRNAIEEAVSRMIAKPPVPDYDTLWDPATEVRSVEVRDGAIEVDLALPGAPIVHGDADLAIQQLVYTATAAASLVDSDYGSLPVRILVEGEQVDELDGVDVSDVLRRHAPLDVRQLVQLNEPSQNATVRSPVRVSGDAAVFEATIVWELRQDGSVVDSGFENTQEGQRFSEFSFELELEPGEYTIVITEDDVSGGEGGEPMSDERTFTVVE
ncbi:MAG TPA: Gmad2 immunoglobulin-like domain-containing protein [Jiangellaceae bacterium]|nr:Gmad2 immunoglobulin-like domain-containing protein [Jiangellaceae bacterium]